MSPIFKRYFAKQALITFGFAVFCTVILSLALNTGERWLDTVKENISAYDVTPAAFETVRGIERIQEMSDKMQETDWYSRGIHYECFAQNTAGVIVPLTSLSVSVAFEDTMGLAGMLALICAAALAASAFYSERKKNTVNFIGSLPFRREKIFAEKWLAGSLCLLILFAVYYLLFSVWALHMRREYMYTAERLLYYDSEFPEALNTYGSRLLVYTCASFAFYGLIMFANTLFGKPGQAFALTLASAAAASAGIKGMAFFYIDYDLKFSRGFLRKALEKVSELFHSAPKTCCILLAVTGILFLSGLLCDKAAKRERSGSLFMFEAVKYAVYTFFMVSGAFSFYMFAVDICSFNADTLCEGMIILAAGAAASALMLNKFTREV